MLNYELRGFLAGLYDRCEYFGYCLNGNIERKSQSFTSYPNGEVKAELASAILGQVKFYKTELFC